MGFHGFTLVELMVAVSILTLMILFLFSVFNQATQAWQASEKKVDAFREARAALYVMRRDLGGAVITSNLSLNSNLAPANIPVAGQMASTNSLFFISAQSAEAQGGSAQGDLCAIGYYVAWSTNEFKTTASGSNNLGVSRSFNLFRHFKDSVVTYANMKNYWLAGGGTNPMANLTNLYQGVSSASFTGDEVLARNVVAFAVQPYARNGAGTPVITNGAITNRISYLDINLTVINYDTAAKLGDGAGNGANWNTNSASPGVKSLIGKNQQDFYTRIPFKP